MKKNLAILLVFLFLLAPAALAEADPVESAPDPAGDWYASVDGVPVTLSLGPDGGYSLVLPAVLGQPQAGTWVLDDGFVRLDDGSALNLVNEGLLVWSENGLFFTRDAPALYAPADLLADAPLELCAGYWRCAFVDLGDAVVPAEAVDENTDLYIEDVRVALGGPRFGDIFWTFEFTNGALTADVNGQPVALALQQDGCLRLTIEDAGEMKTLYLQHVIAEEAEDE